MSVITLPRISGRLQDRRGPRLAGDLFEPAGAVFIFRSSSSGIPAWPFQPGQLLRQNTEGTRRGL
jgi:hypothetical protein